MLTHFRSLLDTPASSGRRSPTTRQAEPSGPVDQPPKATAKASAAATADLFSATAAGLATARPTAGSPSTQSRRTQLSQYVPRIATAAAGSNSDKLAKTLASSRAERQGSAPPTDAEHRAVRALYREEIFRGRSASPAVDSAGNTKRENEVRESE